MATITESFNTANQDTLGPDQTWTSVSGTWKVRSNQATINSSTASTARCEAVADTSDMYAEVVVEAMTGTIVQYAVIGRFQPAANSGYLFQLSQDGSIALRRMIAGTRTDLVTGSVTVSVPDTIRIEVVAEGSDVRLRGYVNGVQELTYLDTDASRMTTGVRGGLYGFSNGTAESWRVDSFEAGDVQTSTPATVTPTTVAVTASVPAPTVVIPATTYTEPFTSGSFTLTWTELAGDLRGIFASSRGTCSSNVVMNARAEHDVNNDNVSAEVTVAAFGTGSISQIGPVARYQTAANTGYLFYMEEDGNLVLRRLNAGTYTTLATDSAVLSLPHTLRIEAQDEGSNVRVRCYVDDVLAITYLDTDANRITSGTRGGLYGFHNGAADSLQFDDFVVTTFVPSGDITVSATTVASAATVPTPTVVASSGSTVTPATVAATTTVPLPTSFSDTTATPAVIVVDVDMSEYSAVVDSEVPVNVVSTPAVVLDPTVIAGGSGTDQTVNATTVAATASIPTPVPTVHYHPDADVSNPGLWTTAPLWEKIDEPTVPNDADFITSPVANGSRADAQIQFQDITPPPTLNGHKVRVRARSNGADTTTYYLGVIVEQQGASTYAVYNTFIEFATGGGTTFQTYEFNLDPELLVDVVDWSQVGVRLQHNVFQTTTNNQSEVSWVEFVASNAPTTTTNPSRVQTVVSVPTPTIRIDATPTPAVVAAVATVPAATASIPTLVATTVAVTASVPAPVIAYGATVFPAVVLAVASISATSVPQPDTIHVIGSMSRTYSFGLVGHRGHP